MKRTILLTIVLFLSLNLIAQTNHYVDNAASGINTGSSWVNAWQSFSAINWGNIQNGDTVFISGGSTEKTYNETLVIGASGNENGNITIKIGQDEGHNGKAIIGQGIRSLYSKNYINIDGNYNNQHNIVVKNPADRGIYIYLSENVKLSYLEVTACGNGSDQHGIHINYECHNITVDNCYIHEVYQDGINVNCTGNNIEDFIISNCRIENTGDDGIQCVGGLTIHDTYIFTDRTFIVPGAHPDGIQLNPLKSIIVQSKTFLKTFLLNVPWVIYTFITILFVRTIFPFPELDGQ